jgi:thioredoxin-like negative regulator of GroEL
MTLTCPVPSCRHPNDPAADACANCGVPLAAYRLLSVYPGRLFNQALAAAREGRLAVARDLLAAVVHWCPHDVEARNALALACFRLGDREAAARHWEVVRRRLPQDALAASSLAAVAKAAAPAAPKPGKRHRRRGRR